MRDFLIRLLQVLWVLSAAAVPIAIVFGILIDEEGAVLVMIFFVFVWLVGLTIVQYLLFGELHPLSSFDGGLDKDN